MKLSNVLVPEFLSQICRRLDDAAAIARAAHTCADAGSEREALRIAMRLDTLLGEAATLHGAVCLVSRIDRTGDADG